jgi:glutathione-regulated potassium-efflux system ancillary protein KefC/glutathione-regulated potassium-efflux system protein KefB
MSQLAEIAVFLLATVIAVPLFRRFRLSSVLAYLAAGMAIGPSGLGIVSDPEGVLHTAEFGVVLLLFVIGLELQLSRLRAMRRAIVQLGVTQVAVTTVVFALAGCAFGLMPSTAFVAGFALSLSSTPLVLQLLAEREQLNTQAGRSAFAILLFQDIAVMPVLAILPMLSTSRAPHDLMSTLLGAGKGLAVIALVLFGGRYILRPVLRLVALTKVREAFTAAALLVVVGTALLFNLVGLSMALGAFVSGLLLADSEYRHELEADIEPFKGLLLGLFFISVGMTANLGLIVAKPGLVIGFVAALLVAKFILLWIIARVTGHEGESARSLAFALPQGGEFGFVLFSLAVGYGLMDQSLADLLVIVVTTSMVLSPLLMGFQVSVLEPRLSQPVEKKKFDSIDRQEARVIIAGVGRFGQIVSRVLRIRKIPFIALEADAAQVETLRRFGSKVYYGDASRLELLEAAQTASAEIFVLAIDDVEASVRTAELVRRHFPNLKLLARARNRQHALRLMELGVRYIVRETYYSGLEMARHTLEALGLTRAAAVETIERFKVIDEKTLREQLEFKDDEQRLIQSAQLVAKELDRLFEADEERTGANEAGAAQAV